MKRIFWIVIGIMASFTNVSGQGEQVVIEAKFLEVNDDYMQGLGWTFELGTNFGTITNYYGENSVPKWGIKLGAGVEAEPLNRLLVNPNLSFNQTGAKGKNEHTKNSVTYNNIQLGLRTRTEITHDNKIVIDLIIEPYVSYAINHVFRNESNGETIKNKQPFNENAKYSLKD